MSQIINKYPKKINNLALFFSYNISLKDWSASGLLHRDTLLYEHLSKLGYNVTFITYGGVDDSNYLPFESKIKVLSKPNEDMQSHKFGWQIPFLYRNRLKSIDVIKSHQIKGARFAVWAKICTNKLYIARFGYIPSLLAEIEKKSLKTRLKLWREEFVVLHSADLICLPCQAEAEYILKRYKIKQKKIHICPNWIDTKRFSPDSKVLKHPRRICFVGRFSMEKQPLLLIEAIKDIKDIELLMIGGGPLKDQIQSMINENNIRATVLDRIANENLPQYLNSSSIYVLPSLFEGGSPKSLLEAMSCELPVISTDGFGVNEAFVHGIHGLKCKVDNVHDFRNAILTLLNDPLSIIQFGKNSRQHVIANYSIEKAVEREINLLNILSNSKIQ